MNIDFQKSQPNFDTSNQFDLSNDQMMNPQFLTIVQDPYPDINCSPDDIFDPGASCISNQMSLTDYQEMDFKKEKEDTYFFNGQLNM